MAPADLHMRLGSWLLGAAPTPRQPPRRRLSSCRAMDEGPRADLGDLTTLGLARGRVLVVGDGNLSFARALLRHNAARVAAGALELTASSLDSRAELDAMYPSSGEALAELARGGVRVLHGVDATALDAAALGGAFDRVVFNFPHFAAGGSRRNRIGRHRQLLREFLASARGVLRPGAQVWVTLCRGQGGTPIDAPRAVGDTWQLQLCAAAAGMLLLDAHACPVDALHALGYRSVGYQLRERGFWTRDSLTHVLAVEGGGARARFPLAWTRDVSVWVECDDQRELDALVDRELRARFPPPAAVRLGQVDAYTCPSTSRRAVTYRVEVASRHEALSRERMNARMACMLAAIEQSPLASSRAK